MTDSGSSDELVIPIVEERALVSKETIETGRVRIVTRVEEHQESVTEALRHEDVIVERVPIDRIVEMPPVVRREGDTMIYPIVEEILVIEKRLFLKEEVRVTCTSRVETVERQVTLRAVHADVQRFSNPSPSQD